MQDTEQARYPIGRFVRPTGPIEWDRIAGLIEELEKLPSDFRQAVTGLSERQLDAPYRDGGWTIRQVVHHVPESHLNAYVRMKLAVTEARPAIRAYDEVQWAELPDGRDGDIRMSLDLLDALHRRWVSGLRGLRGDQYGCVFLHDVLGEVRVDEAVAHYAWHGRHHLAHVGLVTIR